MTGNGKPTTSKNGDDWGEGLWLSYPHFLVSPNYDQEWEYHN